MEKIVLGRDLKTNLFIYGVTKHPVECGAAKAIQKQNKIKL